MNFAMREVGQVSPLPLFEFVVCISEAKQLFQKRFTLGSRTSRLTRGLDRTRKDPKTFLLIHVFHLSCRYRCRCSVVLAARHQVVFVFLDHRSVVNALQNRKSYLWLLLVTILLLLSLS